VTLNVLRLSASLVNCLVNALAHQQTLVYRWSHVHVHVHVSKGTEREREREREELGVRG